MTVTTTLFKDQVGGQAVPAGKAVFSAGDPADHLYVVQKGKIQIRVSGHVVESIGPGGIFGEMAMIDGSTRSADAVAAEDSVVLPIGSRQFDFLITETPHFARLVMKLLVERLREANSSCT